MTELFYLLLNLGPFHLHGIVVAFFQVVSILLMFNQLQGLRLKI